MSIYATSEILGILLISSNWRLFDFTISFTSFILFIIILFLWGFSFWSFKVDSKLYWLFTLDKLLCLIWTFEDNFGCWNWPSYTNSFLELFLGVFFKLFSAYFLCLSTSLDMSWSLSVRLLYLFFSTGLSIPNSSYTFLLEDCLLVSVLLLVIYPWFGPGESRRLLDLLFCIKFLICMSFSFNRERSFSCRRLILLTRASFIPTTSLTNLLTLFLFSSNFLISLSWFSTLILSDCDSLK